ncbi:MAG: 1-(5-phosphoribosyl)-5-[(5-phosphoribosylamino)methylideneamino]imidazole-4-carboxamide isomerase [Clostridia bacterium]|nr:1-(5-phosphoribosyl)-5-[(5-phosphoribosylamino)methylideneamino]imidazole-4-carboxamide isomerase [Clostridia bacterium]
MIIYPAIDLYGGEAVRLFKGDYSQKTVYSQNPVEVARKFREAGASRIHMVDLEGAKNGGTPNFGIVKAVKEETGLFVEIGGGIRSMDVIERYAEAGIDRVILGTAAVTDPDFAAEAAARFGDMIAVGVDIKDGFAAIRGWTESGGIEAMELCEKMRGFGIKTVICTDISRDGAMKGTNRELYRDMSKRLDMDIIASGGVSSMDDVIALAGLGIHGAIIGKAYYTGAIDLKEAVAAAEGGKAEGR